MAYADYQFYKDSYYGDILTEGTAPKWLDRASDLVDIITFRRLEKGFPTDEHDAVKVMKSVCAVADVLFRVDEQQQAASANKDSNGVYRSAVASISSGRESISYSQTAAMSVYAKAAADNQAYADLVRDTATKYLSNVPDKFGINLLYAGVV